MRAAILYFFPLVCLLLVASLAKAGETEERPNIIFILADDQGWNDIGYHNPQMQTPHLDRLAAEGVRLQQHYAYATCSPTRVALISGRYPSRFDVLAPLAAKTHFRGEEATLPRTLQRLGYRTHISGKWHIGETPEHRPRHYGFETTYGYFRGQIDPYTHRYKFGDHLTWHRNDEFVEEAGHVTDLITDEAIRVIEDEDERPFFLYVSHHSPHYPLNEPPRWIALYDETFDDIWRRHYAAAITHMDHEIGRIVEALERTGKRDRTVIVYSSDNGGQRNWSAPESEYNGRYAAHTTLGDNRPLRGWKTELYEGGIRVPAFVHWPRALPAGKMIESATHTCDWAPTLIRLAGGDPAENPELEGVDLGPLLRHEVERLPSRTLYWRTPRQLALRQDQWKLIADRDLTKFELYDLDADLEEKHNVANQYPDRLSELQARLLEHRRQDWPER
jgi:arylsulfatase A-like enzyme